MLVYVRFIRKVSAVNICCLGILALTKLELLCGFVGKHTSARERGTLSHVVSLTC